MVTIPIQLTISEDHRDVYDRRQRGRPCPRPTRGCVHVHVHVPGFLAGPFVTPTLFSFFRSMLQRPSQHSSSLRRSDPILGPMLDDIDEVWNSTHTQMVSLPSPFFTLSWNTPLVWRISKVQFRR